MGEASAHAEVVVRSRGWVTGRISYLPAVATLCDGELRVVSHASRRGGRPAYDKTMAVPRGTSTARAGRPGRPHSLRVVAPPPPGGRKPKVRELDCRTGAGVAFWESAIEDAQRAPAARRARARGAAAADDDAAPRPSDVDAADPREAFVVRVDASAARARWARAIGAVVRELRRRRRRERGFSPRELAALPKRLALLRASGARAGGRRRGADDAFAEDLAAVVTRDFTLASLGRSVAYLVGGGGVSSVGDAALALVAVKCVRLVGLAPHALGELSRLKRERANLKRFAFGALQLRLPLLSAVVCDLLAALCKEKEGLRVVDAVLDRVDGAARFGDAALARAPLAPAAPRAAADARPPRYAALADLLNARDADAPLAAAAARLFAATCDAEKTRSAALARGALYCRAANAVVRVAPAAAAPKATLAKSASRDRAPAPAARRRRAPPDVLARAAAGAGGARGEEHRCPPLLALSRAAAAAGDPAARAVGAAADAFLGACDARERDEAADCDAAAPGGERRGRYLADRAKRAAWLAGDARADGVLRALGEDLEADRGSLGARRRPAAPAAGEPPRLADALRAMDGDLVFGDGLADLDARMTRTVADRRAARAERSRLAQLHRARARDAAARREGRAAAAAEAAQTAPAAAARDDPRLERYARMLKMHVPYGAVRAKMEADGLDIALLDAAEPGAAPRADDAALAKYLKMLQMHVPRGAVENKMRADGLDPALLDGGAGVAGAAADAAVDVGAPVVVVRRGPPPGCERKPRVKTRRVYLDYASDDDELASGDWWRGFDAPLRSKAAADLEDVFGLVDRGAAAAGAAETKKAQPASKKRSLVTELFGDRRALELNVLHGNVRARDDAVAEALLTLDGGRLGARALADGVARCLEPLRAFFASAAEIRAVQAAVRRDGFRDADAARLLAPSLDAPSALFAVVACGVPRCAAKVGYLWLEATYADRCAELMDGGVAPLKTAATQVAGSYGLRDVLRTALGVANFANHGTARAQRPGVRTSALGKLREARARGGGAEAANLLQYVARHARVKPQVLRRELGGLADAAQATSRDALAEELRALTTERHGADAERERLAAEGSAVSDLAAARVARVVADVDVDLERASPRAVFSFLPPRARRPRSTPPLLVGLEAALLDVNADVDGCLRSYGEDPKTTDFQAWIDDILGFVDAYGKEFEDREEAKLRERRRRELESKKRARAAALGAAEPGGAARRPSRRPSQQRDSQSGADFTSFLRNVRAGAALEAEDRGDLSDDGWSDDDDEGRSPGGQLTPKDTS